MTYNEIIQKAGKRITKHVYYIKNNVTTNVSDDNIDKIKLDTQTPLIGTSINGCELTLKEKIDGDIYVQIVARYQEYQDTKTYGPFNLKEEPKYDANKKTYLHKTFDGLLKSMVDYQPLNITFPCTVYNFFANLVSTLGYINNIQSLPNGSQLIPLDIYNNIGFTYRDVLDDIAVANGVLFYIDTNEIKIATLGNNPITIDDDILKNQNIDFGKHYGPINSIVLSRSGESDNVYIWDEESILQNGMHEFKIVDNQLMNENNRSDYLSKLLEQLDNIEYDIYDTEFVGFGELYPLQSVTFNTNNKTYNSYIFNNEITLTTGYKQAIYNDMPEQSETDYKSADKTDKRINQAYIITRKNTAEIEALASATKIISNEIISVNQIQLENAYKGSLHYLSIKGQMSLLYPANDLYPADDLYPVDSYLLVDNDKIWLDINYLNFIDNNVCDEFVYEDGKCKIIRRVGETSGGVLFPLQNEVIEERQDALIEVDENSTIKMESFDNLIYSVNYLLKNDYTDTFAPSIDLISKINLTPGNVLIEASKLATISADKIDLAGKEIDLTADNIRIKSKYFNLDEEGNMEANSGSFGGQLSTSSDCTVGNNLYVGANQGNTEDIFKAINFTDQCYIGRVLTQTGQGTIMQLQADEYSVSAISDTYDIPIEIINAGSDWMMLKTESNGYVDIDGADIHLSSNPIIDSDKRLKQEIKDVNVNWINELRVKEYEYKNNSNKKHIGLIAQDYIDKDYAKYFLNKKKDGYYGIAYNNITNALIQYCQELNNKVNKQQEEIDILKKEMEEIKNGINRI